MVGYIGVDKDGAKFLSWKAAFENISDLPAQRTCSVLDNFNHLKSLGLLGVGRYDVLRKLLHNNKEAQSAIDVALEEMANILEREDIDRNMFCGYFCSIYILSLNGTCHKSFLICIRNYDLGPFFNQY